MSDKTQQLETLVSQVLARQDRLKEQNKTLANRVRALEENTAKLKKAEKELKDLRAWKKTTQTVLRRLAARIGKEIEKAQQQDQIG